MKCYRSHNRLKIPSKSIGRRLTTKTVSGKTEKCLKLAKFDPDDERWGTEEIRRFERQRYSDLTKCLKIRRIQKRRSVKLTKKVIFDQVYPENMMNDL